MKIAGVVVLYNPSVNILKNIASYIEQIDILYAVDNSDVINEIVIAELKKNDKISYISNGENLGIGVAFNIAAKLSIKKKYDYLLTMDQDSVATINMISTMVNACSGLKNIGIISPVHVNKFNTQKISKEPITEKFDVMASGNLVNLNAYQKVNGFNEEYFIDYVDVEFCLKMNLNYCKIIQVNKAKLLHEEANITKIKFFGKIYYPYNHSSVRLYYKTRNRLYLKQEYYENFREYFLAKEKLVYRNTILKILLFEDKKIKKVYMILKGYIDFYRGVKGKFW